MPTPPTTTRHASPRRARRAVLLGLAPLLVACAADVADDARRPPSEPLPAPAPPAPAPAPQELVVRTRDFAFDAPDTVVAGPTVVRLTNDGPEFHHVLLVRLDEGRTVAELLRHFRTGREQLPDWALDVGGPNTPGAPGGRTAAALDLPPGSYAILCVVPGSADGRPHVMQGMARALTVLPAGSPAPVAPTSVRTAAAASDARTLTLDDYGFTLDAPLAAGRRTLHVVNRAAQSHELVIVRLAPGRSADDFLAFLGRPEGEPPGTIVGGVTWLARGRSNEIAVDFAPGDYAFICFVPDASDGRPHFMHGMVEQLRVE